VWDGLFHSRPGSALRFSQPLSGFSKLEFHGLVSCRNRSWASPFRAFPSRRSCTPSEVTFAPLRLSTDVLDTSATPPCHHRFPRRPRFRRSCLVPPAAMGSLSTSRGPLPVRPGHAHLSRPFRQLHPLRSFPPPVSPFAPSPGCPGWAAAALLGFCPSRVPFQTSEPRTLRGDSTPASGEAFPLSRATTGQPRR